METQSFWDRAIPFCGSVSACHAGRSHRPSWRDSIRGKTTVKRHLLALFGKPNWQWIVTDPFSLGGISTE
jgi:hypothetical protein